MNKFVNNKIVVALDVGGSKIAGALWFVGGNLDKKYEIRTEIESSSGVLNGIFSTLDNLVRDAKNVGEILAIGIGIAGQIDYENGTVFSPTNLRVMEPIPLKFITETRYGYPVFVDNDTNLGALGEAKFGVANRLKNFIYLSIGTGIGSGIVIEGKLYHGAHGLAGEVGHMSMMPKGPKCDCGGRGCVEGIISGRAIAKRAKEYFKDVSKNNPNEINLIRNGIEATAKDVFIAAKLGDTFSQKIVKEFVFYLGTLILNLVNFLDPEAIVLGGGIGQDIDELIEPLNQFIRKRMNLNRGIFPKILRCGLEKDSCLIGAALQCLEFDTPPMN